MVEALQITVLGSPNLQLGERPLTADLISLKGQALLIYLAVTGKAHARTHLAGLLWGDLPEESARANLRLTLSKLRKFLPATCLITTRLEVKLENYWLDVALLEKKFEPDLYRGDFLTGFVLPYTPEFETWALSIREHLRQTAVTHLYQLVETAVHTQQAQPGIQAARQLLTIDPWHEEAHRQLMLLLAAAGQRSAALSQYETCRRLLDEELGIEPSRETHALHQQILDDQVTKWPDDHPLTLSPRHLVTQAAAGNIPPHNLPTQFTPFIGRTPEIEKLKSLLQDGRSRLITLVGEGGVGKTRLALAVAEQLLPHFPDGIWFVSLAGLEQSAVEVAPDPENSVASAVAAALNFNFGAGAPPKQQLSNYLKQRQALLLLDNFEPLLAAAGLVLNLLSNAPHIAIVATSREPLKIQAERIFRLDGLAVPPEDDWETAVTSDSLQLFAERAERATGQNLLTPENMPLLLQLCRFVNGLPLGIELMADWTRWLSLGAIAADLQTNLLQLERTQQDVPARHRSLQAVFNYSWQMLSPEEQLTLAQLSVFHGGFQLDGVKSITQSSPATLFALIDKSLVQHQTADFYTLHDLLRGFAQNRLAELAIDTKALRDRHARHYLTRLAQRTADYFGAEPQQALHQTQQEAENLGHAWQWAAERPLPHELFSAVLGMGAYWNYAGLFLEGERVLHRTREMIKDARLQAALANEHATLLFELTWLEEMKAAAEMAVQCSTDSGDAILEANGRLRLGQYFWRRGELEAAETALKQAEQLAQKLNLPHLEGIIFRSLAANAWQAGNLAEAALYGERSVQRHQQTGDARGLNRSLFFMALLAHERHEHATVRAYLEPVRESAQKYGDRTVETRVISLLGRTAVHEGQFEQALSLLAHELQLARETGQLWQVGACLSNEGDIWQSLGQFARAATCYAQALAQFKQLGTQQAQSNVLAYMGLLAARQVDFAHGRSYCEEALQLAQEVNAQREQAFAYTFLGHNLLGLEQLAEAEATYSQAALLWQQLGDVPHQMEAQAGLVRTLLQMEQGAKAEMAAASLLSYLANGTLVGANDPAQIYLTCYTLLHSTKSEQAHNYLYQGLEWLYAQANCINDIALKESFLNQIPSHQALQKLSP